MGPAERERQFETLRQAVRPGGRLVLHGYTPEQIEFGTGGPPYAENMYTPELLQKAFGDWRIQRLAACEREVQEGRGHSGQSALIDLVVDKPVALPKPSDVRCKPEEVIRPFRQNRARALRDAREGQVPRGSEGG